MLCLRVIADAIALKIVNASKNVQATVHAAVKKVKLASAKTKAVNAKNKLANATKKEYSNFSENQNVNANN